VDKYNHPRWHFINYPFVFPPDPTKAQEFQPKPSSDPAAPDNILEAIALNKATLMKAEASDEDKAISLCWLFHLIGDIHQPLHSAMLVNSKLHPPDWDRGGNMLLVIPPDRDRVTNLHFYWDALVLCDDPKYSAVETVAQNLRHAASYARQALPELVHTNATDWAQESYQLAKKFAYLDGRMKIVTGHEDQPPDGVPVLSPAYDKDATAVAEKRLALSGYRLADELKAIFKEP
jgi:hypothetical protein